MYLDRCLRCLLVIHVEMSCRDLDIAIWRSKSGAELRLEGMFCRCQCKEPINYTIAET